ncbi:PEP-CTERM sorting domain-containing protein [bacterium]|nr:PEP-CTERM sorting domain-containing protein [bacterium]
MNKTIIVPFLLTGSIAASHAAAIYLGDTRNAGTPPAGITNPNDATSNLDGWNSNMVIMNGQGYSVDAGDVSGGNALVVTEFNFMAGAVRGRVTPFIAEVVSPTEFNILAVGDTRVSGVDYNSVGIHNLSFSNAGAVDLSSSVSAGMVIAAGFLNSNADGTNTTSPGSVIPFNGNVAGGDQWYNGNSAVDTYPAGVATVGNNLSAAPAAGVNNRAYEFNIGLEVTSVPEPGTGLAGIVGLGLLAFKRRR